MTIKEITKQYKELVKNKPCAVYGDLTTQEKAVAIRYITNICKDNDFALTVFLPEFMSGYKQIQAYKDVKFKRCDK